MSLQPIKKRIRSFAICDLEKLKDYSDFFSVGTVLLRPRGHPTTVFFKYLFGEANAVYNFLLLEDG